MIQDFTDDSVLYPDSRIPDSSALKALRVTWAVKAYSCSAKNTGLVKDMDLLKKHGPDKKEHLPSDKHFCTGFLHWTCVISPSVLMVSTCNIPG